MWLKSQSMSSFMKYWLFIFELVIQTSSIDRTKDANCVNIKIHYSIANIIITLQQNENNDTFNSDWKTDCEPNCLALNIVLQSLMLNTVSYVIFISVLSTGDLVQGLKPMDFFLLFILIGDYSVYQLHKY